MGLLEKLQIFIIPLLQLLFLFFNPIVLIPAIIIIVVLIKKNKEYKSGAYYQVTKLPYLSVRNNSGRYGEYLTYKYLKQFEFNGVGFLFNIYIPKDNGETTEIDVLMISPRGIFVFESKNYSGWIFGSENQKNWYKTLPAGMGRSHKEHFYNPVMQNRSHIKYLKAFLDEQVPMWSIIVFSDRCTLMSIDIKSNDVYVINRYNVASAVSEIWNRTSGDCLSKNDIAELYAKLYPFTQVDESTKARHIASIRKNHSGQVAQTSQLAYPTAATVPQNEANNSETVIHEEFSSTDIERIPNVAESPAVQLREQETIEAIEAIEAKPIEQQILICPRCNGKLVLRTATRGANKGNQFYGCSNYPRCKYIQNLSKESKRV